MKHGLKSLIRIIVGAVLIGGLMLLPQRCWGMEEALVEGVEKGMGRAVAEAGGEALDKTIAADLKSTIAETVEKMGGTIDKDAIAALSKSITKDFLETEGKTTAERLGNTLERTSIKNAFGTYYNGLQGIDKTALTAETFTKNAVETFRGQIKSISKLAEVERAGVSKTLTVEERTAAAAERTAAATERMSPAEKAVPKTFWAKVGTFGLKTLEWGGLTAAAAVLFMWPQFVLQPLQEAAAKKAQLDTLTATQSFAGLKLAIPYHCIDHGVPGFSLYVYAPADKMPNNDDTAKNWSNEKALADEQALTVDDLFVASGNGQNCGKNGWGIAGLATQNFAGQMIHLGSGYEFFGNGDAVNTKYPFRQPLGPDSDDIDMVNNCMTIERYRVDGLAPVVTKGAPSVEQLLLPGAFWVKTKKFEVSKDRQKGLDAIVRAILGSPSSDLNTGYTYTYDKDGLVTPCPDGQTCRKIDLMPMTWMSDNDQVTLFTKSQAIPFTRTPLVGYDCFIYQTQNTALVSDLKNMLGADQKSLVQDYVLALMGASHGYAQVPLKIPAVQGDGIGWIVNPKVQYLYSLIDGSFTVVATGKAPASNDPILSDFAPTPQSPPPGTAFDGSEPLKTALSKDKGIGQQILAMRKFINDRKTQGPWTFGNYTVSIPPALKGVGLNLYMIDAAKNTTTTVPTGAGTYASDYLVPLDSANHPVTLPSPQHAYFASMVTSTIYTRDLTSVTDQLKFNLLIYPKSPTSQPQQVLIATTENIACLCRYPPPCTGSITAELACDPSATCQMQPCDQTTDFGTLYWEYELNPYNKDLLWLASIANQLYPKLKASDDPILADIKIKPSSLNTKLPCTPGTDMGCISAWDILAEDLAGRVVTGLKNALGLSGIRALVKDKDDAARTALAKTIAEAASNAILTQLNKATTSLLQKVTKKATDDFVKGAQSSTEKKLTDDELAVLYKALWVVEANADVLGASTAYPDKFSTMLQALGASCAQSLKIAADDSAQMADGASDAGKALLAGFNNFITSYRALGGSLAKAIEPSKITPKAFGQQGGEVTPSEALANVSGLAFFQSLLKGAFATFGTDLVAQDTTFATVQDSLNHLEDSLWLIGGRTSVAVSLARSGLIPLSAMYIYQSWSLAPTPKTSMATYLANSVTDLAISDAHGEWASYMASTKGALYLLMGPFAFTSKLMPNIVIQATSVEDIKADTYVYTSPSYPGDYFVVSSSPDNVRTQTEAFDPINPQPYLISLVTGYMYQRQDSGQGNIIKMTDAVTGYYRKVANLDVIRAGLAGPIKGQMGTVIAQAVKPQRYNFGGFELAIAADDLTKNVYVYQDVSGIFDKWSQASPQDQVAMVSNFFVTAHKGDKDSKTGNTPYTPLKGPIDSPDANCIFNIVTGYSYNIDGSLDRTDIFETVFGAKAYANISSVMDARIEALKPVTAAKEATKITPPEVPDLPTAIATALMGGQGTKLPFPYASLTFYSNKYYSVDTDLGTILDYSVKYTGATTDPNNSAQIYVGVLYDDTGSPFITYKGKELDLIRNGVGLFVDAGSEFLAMPLVVPNWDMPDWSYEDDGKTVNVSPQDLNLSATISSGMYQGTYNLYSYSKQEGGTLLYAQYTPAGGTDGDKRYVDMFSGAVRMPRDTTGIAQGVTARYPLFTQTGTTAALMAFGYDDQGNLFMFGPGMDNNYSYWEVDTPQTFKNPQLPDFNPPMTTQMTWVLDSVVIAGAENAYLWQVAQVKDQSAALDQNNSMFVSYGHSPNAPLDGFKEFDVPTGTRGFIEVYEYVGSGPTDNTFATRDVLDVKAGGTRNVNYDHPLILAYKNGGTTATSLFMPASASALPQTSTPLSNLVECTGTDGQTFKAGSYSAKLTQSIDAHTQSTYITIQDTAGTHFYIPRAQSVGGATLNDIQNAIKKYVSTTASGDVVLVDQIDTNSLLPIAGIRDESPDNSGAMFSKVPLSYFSYYKGSYFYQYQTGDTGQLYYRPGAAYVGLTTGILYDSDGMPTHGSLDVASLQLLYGYYGILVPGPGDDLSVLCKATSVGQPKGVTAKISTCTLVPADMKTAKGTPYLVYVGASQ